MTGMGARAARTRAGGLIFLLLVGFILLFGRLIHLQAAEHEPAVDRVLGQQTVRVEEPARRGHLLDRHGRLLAATTASASLAADPTLVPDAPRAAWLLAEILDVPAEDLRARLERRDRRFVWLARRLTPAQERDVRRLRVPGLFLRTDPRREHPHGRLAGSLLGIVGVDGRGLEGIELTWDETLRGIPGWHLAERDAVQRRYARPGLPGEPAVPGADLHLTLDLVVQHHVEDLLDRIVDERDPVAATVVVLDPRTGDVLAAGTRPTYDPDRPTTTDRRVLDFGPAVRVYEPGSIFKPFLVAAALDRGLVDPDEEIFCEHGAWHLGFRVLHDFHPYGTLRAEDVVVKSSNIGAAKIAGRLPDGAMNEAVRAFGFGRRTGAPVPGESPGLLPPGDEWDRFARTSVPMGHEIATTPLQIVRAFSAVINGGVLPELRFVDRVAGADGTLRPGDPLDGGRRVLSAETSATMRRILRQVVVRGTGRRAARDDYELLGKTGTAEKIDPETGQYLEDVNVASFLCAAPWDDPRAVVLVSVDEPRKGEGRTTGGLVAAPYASDLIGRILPVLGVPPADTEPGSPR